MDFSSTSLYQTLAEWGGEGVHEAFAMTVKTNISDEVLMLMHTYHDALTSAKTMITTLQRSQNDEAKTKLYSALEQLTDEQLTSLIDEMGEEEVGMSIAHAKRVKFGSSDVLNRLKEKYARDVLVIPKSQRMYDNPRKVVLIDFDMFKVPETWTNLEKIVAKRCNLILHEHLNLKYIKCARIIDHVYLPSVKYLKTSGSISSTAGFPNVEILLVRDVDYPSLMPSVLVSSSTQRNCHMFPNLKINFAHGAMKNTIIAGQSFVERRHGDLCGFPRHLKIVDCNEGVRFFRCKVIVEQLCTERKEFYCCKFVDGDGSKLKKDVVKQRLPNSIFLS